MIYINTDAQVKEPEPMIDMTDTARLAYAHYDAPVPFPSIKCRPWVALFIDGDGLASNIQIAQVLSQAEQLGDVVVKRIFGNKNIHSSFTQWKRIYHTFKFERRIFIGVHKNIADMGIVAEAVELALTKPEIDYFVIVSHDGGFFPLMAKLDELKKKVLWVGGEAPLKKAQELRKEIEAMRNGKLNSNEKECKINVLLT